MHTAIFLAVLCGLIYLLYRRGYAVSKRIRAIIFVFRPGRDADRAEVNACTGWVCHAGRFRESRVYQFTFDAQLSQGDAEVTLRDRDRQPLLRLNRQSPAGSMELDGKSRYTLYWEFKSATGRCTLRW